MNFVTDIAQIMKKGVSCFYEYDKKCSNLWLESRKTLSSSSCKAYRELRGNNLRFFETKHEKPSIMVQEKQIYF